MILDSPSYFIPKSPDGTGPGAGNLSRKEAPGPDGAKPAVQSPAPTDFTPEAANAQWAGADPLRVVAMGGGTGLSTLLRGLKHFVASPLSSQSSDRVEDPYPLLISDLAAV